MCTMSVEEKRERKQLPVQFIFPSQPERKYWLFSAVIFWSQVAFCHSQFYGSH